MTFGSSLYGCCWIFCCPPFIKTIVNKLSFSPPKPSSYQIVQISDSSFSFRFFSSRRFSGIIELQKFVFPYLVLCSNHVRLACLHIIGSASPLYTILHSHGNACDIGDLFLFYVELAQVLNCNFVLYDYNGYGASSGHPSEANLLSNVEQVHRFIVGVLKIPPEKIILMGHSIGSVPTLHLASKIPVAGVILQAPIASGLRFFFPSLTKNLFFDVFKNVEVIKKVTAPVLIIHGLVDSITPVQNGYLLYQNAPNKVEPLWLSDSDHNNIEDAREYIPTLQRFLTKDLKPFVSNNSF